MIKIPKEARQKMIADVQTYFEEERGESIGELGADLLVDLFMKVIGPYYYNQGVQDAKQTIEERWFSLEEDIEALKRQVKKL